MIFLPIRTDSPVRRTPYVNFVLIAVNILVFLVTDVFANAFGPEFGEHAKMRWAIWPEAPLLAQFFTYQFMHGDFLHLFGNLLFLWIFGNSVNSKMGHVTYLMFYLAGGIFSGVAFSLVGDAPCLGASGAIAAVTTAFLVLFPRSEVTCFYWLWFYVGTLHVGALLLIGIKVILWDNLVAPRLFPAGGMVQVAYAAHVAGYMFGFVVCCFLLLIRALPRDQFDIVALARRAYQRHQYRTALNDPDARARAELGRVARPVMARPARSGGAPETDEGPIAQLRREIADRLGEQDYAGAAERYEALVALDPEQCLPQSNMMLVANQFMAMGRHSQAAAAYERFLRVYPTAFESLQVKLMLGILYTKYLRQFEAAMKYLSECAARFTIPDQQEKAQQWLSVAQSGGEGALPAT